MSLFYKLLLILSLVSFNANAYGVPKGLYILEYPVNMPNTTLISEANIETPISALKADLTIMTFWAKNCSPCLREMKALEKLYKTAKEDNINVVLVSSSLWKSNEQERKFLTKYGAPTIPFYKDTDNQLSLKLGIGSTPFTVIMNKQGKKVATIRGETDWTSETLYETIKKLAQ